MSSPLTPQVAYSLRTVLQGRQNITLPITLAVGTSTTIIDVRISGQSQLELMPLTAHAAAIKGSLYVSSRQTGQATLTYANTAFTDCNFQMAISG